MRTTRREFVRAIAAAPLLGPTLLGTQDKSGSKPPVLGTGAHKYEAIHDWGKLPPQISWGNTHGVVEDSQHNIYVHHTVHATSESADSMVVFDQKGKFIRSWGKEFKGVAHGLHIRKEGSDEFLYLTVNAANARQCRPPEMQAVVIKATPKGEIVWKIQGPPDVDAYKPAADGTPKRYNPTNVAIAPNGDIYVGDGYGSYLRQPVQQQGRVHPHVRRQGIRSGPARASRTGYGSTRAARHRSWSSPIGATTGFSASRSTDTHIDFITGFRLPCHFDEQKGMVVVPDLHGRVTLMDSKNGIIEHLGDSNAPDWNNPLRTQPREAFIPGQFICPHGACFDHAGNIFVVEWVEVGRVTKLVKV